MRRSKTPPSIPWEPLLPTLLSVLHTAAEHRLKAQWRDDVGWFLFASMLLCRESREIVSGHAFARFLLFYERWRRHGTVACESRLFMEMWPPFVPLDGPFCGTAVSDKNAVRRLDTHAAVADRVACVNTLEMRETNLDLVRTRFFAPDLPADLPLSVKIFVGRARFIYCAVAKEHSDDDVFAHCRVCGRGCFFRRTTSEDSEGEDDAENEDLPPVGSVASQREYWRLCGGLHPLLDRNQSKCCSSLCERRAQVEINTAMAITSDELLHFDAPPLKEGNGRVPVALRSALKRNEIVARRMRATENHAYEVLSPEEVDQLRSMSVTMMNVDVSLLYAAAHITESPALRRGLVVPPLTCDWRSMPTMCRSAVVACRELYNAHRPRRQTTLVSSVVAPPRFLTKSRDKAVSFF